MILVGIEARGSPYNSINWKKNGKALSGFSPKCSEEPFLPVQPPNQNIDKDFPSNFDNDAGTAFIHNKCV